jgi:hypothetical protein
MPGLWIWLDKGLADYSGHEIFRLMRLAWKNQLLPIRRQHHGCWDGNSYRDRLAPLSGFFLLCHLRA